jgi:hypothetical protein
MKLFVSCDGRVCGPFATDICPRVGEEIQAPCYDRSFMLTEPEIVACKVIRVVHQFVPEHVVWAEADPLDGRRRERPKGADGICPKCGGNDVIVQRYSNGASSAQENLCASCGNVWGLVGCRVVDNRPLFADDTPGGWRDKVSATKG